MGEIVKYVSAMAMILCMFYVGLLWFSETLQVGGQPATANFTTFNESSRYASLFNNKTQEMRVALQQEQNTQQNNPLGAVTLINIFIQGGSLAAVGLFAMVDIGAAILNDFGTVLLIPVFFITMMIVVFVFKFAAQIMRAIRLGDI